MRKEKGGKSERKKMDEREKESEEQERIEVAEEGIERREEEEIEERPEAIEEAVEEEERCEEDIEPFHVRRWFESQRTRYGKLSKLLSGQSLREMTKRQSWVYQQMGFLKTHIR